MSYREVYEKWCNDPYFDEASREELKDSKEMRQKSKTVSTVSLSSVPADSAVSSERVPTA